MVKYFGSIARESICVSFAREYWYWYKFNIIHHTTIKTLLLQCISPIFQKNSKRKFFGVLRYCMEGEESENGMERGKKFYVGISDFYWEKWLVLFPTVAPPFFAVQMVEIYNIDLQKQQWKHCSRSAFRQFFEKFKEKNFWNFARGFLIFCLPCILEDCVGGTYDSLPRGWGSIIMSSLYLSNALLLLNVVKL